MAAIKFSRRLCKTGPFYFWLGTAMLPYSDTIIIDTIDYLYDYNQSINQIFYSANIAVEARLSGAALSTVTSYSHGP